MHIRKRESKIISVNTAGCISRTEVLLITDPIKSNGRISCSASVKLINPAKSVNIRNNESIDNIFGIRPLQDIFRFFLKNF